MRRFVQTSMTRVARQAVPVGLLEGTVVEIMVEIVVGTMEGTAAGTTAAAHKTAKQQQR